MWWCDCLFVCDDWLCVDFGVGDGCGVVVVFVIVCYGVGGG